MSDNIRDDNLNVDPPLDALLSRALSRGSVPRQQRQRHLERLGIAPRLGGSASMWRAPVVAGRPPSSSTPQPASLPARRRRRQWLEVCAALLAIVLVGGLLVALFRDWSGGEGDQQLAASPEATTPAPTTTPRETREQLYVVSHAMTSAQDALITEGRVSAIDPETGEEFWSVEAGPRIDSVLSPDGKRLFVADSQRESDFVYALDTQTGRELWRQPIENRQWLKPATGQSMLSVSLDGATVSVYTCEGCTGEFRSNTGRNWLAQFNAHTGNRLIDLEITACRGTTILGPESLASRPLYVICDTNQRLEAIDLATGQPLTLTYDQRLEGGFPESTGINASVVSPDGRLLYLASGNRLTVVDMTRHSARRVQLAEDINVERRLPLLAVSPDGERLFIGSLDTGAYDRGRAEVNRVDVYDTATWEPLGQAATSYPLNGQAFNTTPDGDGVYGTFVSYSRTDDNAVESTILRLTLDGEPQTVASRTNEEVLYLFAGTVEVDPDATPRPTPTPEPTAHEWLFAVSHILSTGGEIVGGRVTAYDTETGDIAYWIDTGTNPDAILSPDGTRLYIVANDEEQGDILTSYEALSGDENWSVAVENRVQWMRGEGPTTLAMSQDGSRLFIYSASAPGDYTIQVFDTADGRLGRVIDGVAGCTAQFFPSADGRTLYVVCLAERFAPQVIDLEAWTSAGVMQGFGGIISGAAATADGRHLYITNDIDSELRLTIIDTNGRVISNQRDIVHMGRDPLHSLNLTAISPDGSRLFIGVGNEPEDGIPSAREIWVWDTSMLHVGSIQALWSNGAMQGWSLASGADNRSVFANTGGSILRLHYNSLEARWEELASRPDWKVLRLFSGRVTDTPAPPSTDAPEPAPSTPPDNASVCPTTPLADLEGRDANLLPEAYWIEGDGLALGHVDGRLIEGENALAWVVDSPGIVDPDTSARVAMRGSRVGTSYGGSVPLELRDFAIEYNVVREGDVEHHIDSTFVFPTYGCWQIEAEFGSGWVRAIVYVEPDYSIRNPAMIWDVLRWRPLHELGIDSTPPCLRMPAQQVIDDFGPLVGDMQTNDGPVYLNGPGEDGAILIEGGAAEDGGYYARVMFVTGGDYTGPILVRSSPGSGPIGFTLAPPDTTPAGEWHLQDPAGTSPTAGVRHWIVYLRFDGPGCHALQIDGLDFTSIIVFEVMAEGGS